MTEQFIIHLARETFFTALLVSAPVLIASAIVGLIISIFQSATSINEMTLTFVPKLIVIAIVTVIALPWIIDVLVSFTKELFNQIPNIAK
ncbi:flagellar biosynthetic protein FliQ [Candidatus Kryptonium thompsonii]|jgi:flagellar biosynthetic protein FliQ|uniref:Flagellar biosynthetic protein FliQ n=1 Tax=Candidatus Kryptonium thompsonii TaxID=1633631 RepID=A0A0P1LRX0_9BACT|nr:flagellar biosynthesis protein FliQ [Candidatus Kryptonium thompsoni]CUS77576.1 flagellar biosynthetic protein FliQ [Candidatus Kryptonium thompsoni]CUS79690.1 flagellar biosynthetic protein FliQ [Candidatus Kryptonium thompsoni]CUS80954.1 flagellar biosynthetic protein FliQ [Candidatus Kryptonium thompsoni]CUS82906.1 flagellar biosynthetic protein FliQ [Candidatus Kryptonium thompsoni]CUS84543.1 flagellar biosynthetic protein FliQ [Candidatus Kryptonium thompsoni]